MGLSQSTELRSSPVSTTALPASRQLAAFEEEPTSPDGNPCLKEEGEALLSGWSDVSNGRLPTEENP